eukprot:6209139-Prymnesium_polylepis.3
MPFDAFGPTVRAALGTRGDPLNEQIRAVLRRHCDLHLGWIPEAPVQHLCIGTRDQEVHMFCSVARDITRAACSGLCSGPTVEHHVAQAPRQGTHRRDNTMSHDRAGQYDRLCCGCCCGCAGNSGFRFLGTAPKRLGAAPEPLLPGGTAIEPFGARAAEPDERHPHFGFVRRPLAAGHVCHTMHACQPAC